MTTGYRDSELRWALLPVTLAATLVAAIWLRYGGSWAEVDTTVLTRAARATMIEGTIKPKDGVYLNGFVYPSLLGFLSTETGLPIRTIQTTIAPWCLLGTALVAFVAFRAILGSGRQAAVAACLLLIQPDFLFVNQRGSHEKVTWTLVLMLLFALVTSFRRQRFAYAAPLAVVFYLGGFALICTNAFFASSLITSFIMSFAGGTVVSRWLLRDRSVRPFFRRLGYIFVTLFIFSYVYIVYIFPPARANLENLQGVFDRISALYLDVETSASESRTALTGTVSTAAASPYTTVALAWTNPRVFFVLTALTWILIATAAVSWLIDLVRFFRRGTKPTEAPIFLMWIFAGATGLQILASVVADASGALGSNLQLRLFPAFSLFIIPLVVATVRLPKRLWIKRRVSRVALFVLATSFAFFTTTAYLKATNDPLVSNKWVFYTDAEAAMLLWTDAHLAGVRIWGEFDERMIVADIMLAGDKTSSPLPGARWVGSMQPGTGTRYIAISDVTTKRALRLRGPVPDTRGTDLIYDNGSVRIYHRIPESPYVP